MAANSRCDSKGRKLRAHILKLRAWSREQTGSGERLYFYLKSLPGNDALPPAGLHHLHLPKQHHPFQPLKKLHVHKVYDMMFWNTQHFNSQVYLPHAIISCGALCVHWIRTPKTYSFSNLGCKSPNARSQVIFPFATLVPMVIFKNATYFPMSLSVNKGMMSHTIMWLWLASWDNTWDVLTARSQTQEKIRGGKLIHRGTVVYQFPPSWELLKTWEIKDKWNNRVFWDRIFTGRETTCSIGNWNPLSY